MFKNVKFILTDIEGTTSSISFVAEELFPYFRNNIQELIRFKHLPFVQECFQNTVELAFSEDGESISTDQEILNKLFQWSVEDRKITPLKALQGVLWEQGYKDGTLKGHVFPEVANNLEQWTKKGISCGVFSSGSVPAQKLIFGYSLSGDLTKYFSAYYDTKTGGKRDSETYSKIHLDLKLEPFEVLFLSDVVQELEAARAAGMQTIQLVRPGTKEAWSDTAENFNDVNALLD